MGIYGGLKPEDWQNWGAFTTFKSNAAELLCRQLRPDQVIYCSPLVDPYQPAEAEERQMPGVLDALIAHPPKVFTMQTRGPLILRDIDRMVELGRRTRLRVSFSITTDREDVRRWYEPHCATTDERLGVVRELRAAGIRTHATLAPLLPCNPERLADLALDASGLDLVGDPFHVRAVKTCGATTRVAGLKVSHARGFDEWHDPGFQREIVRRIERRASAAGRRFGVGPEGFAWLAEDR
jgi:DNA repair photolyase